MITRLTPHPQPTFGARYKREVVLDVQGAGAASVGSSVLAGSAALGPQGAWVVGALASVWTVKMSKPHFKIEREGVADPKVYTVEKETPKVQARVQPKTVSATVEKAQPTAEELQREQTVESIQKAMKSLEADRAQHQKQLTQIQQGAAAEEARLSELEKQFNAIKTKTDELMTRLDEETDRTKKLQLTQLAGKASAEYEQLEMKVKTQTATVEQMRKNAETAATLFGKINAKLTEKEKEYQLMLARVNQTEQYKQLAALQQSLEALQRTDDVPEELRQLREGVEKDFFTSQARADQVVTDHLADVSCQTQEEANILESLRRKQEELRQANKSAQ